MLHLTLLGTSSLLVAGCARLAGKKMTAMRTEVSIAIETVMGRIGAASTLASFKQRQNEWQQRIDGPNQINTAQSRELGVTDILSRLGFAFQRWVALCLVPLGICGVENSSIRLASARSNDRHNSNVIGHSPIGFKRRRLLKKASSYQTETKH